MAACRARPLLLLAGLVATGCKAERLGVEVPRGGVDALSAEDLSRDTFAFVDPTLGADRSHGSPGGEEARARLEQRLQQMHTLPAFGNSYRGEGGVVCGQKDGRSGKTVVIAGLSEGEQVHQQAVPWAAVISLAKAWDQPAPPPHTLVFCGFDVGGLAAYARRPAAPLDQTLLVLTVGPLGDGPLELSPASTAGPVQPAPWVRASAPAQSAAVEGMADLDLREVVGHLQRLVGEVEARTKD